MKRTLAPLALALATALGLPSAIAAQDAAADPAQDAMEALLEAVSPDEHHAVLESFTGSWQHAIKFYPAPDAPPSEMTATSVSELTMGGRYLVSEYAGEFWGAPFQGRDLIGYDKMKGKYFSVWVDNMSTGPMVLWGDWDPATKTLRLEGTVSDPMSGNPAVAVRNTSRLLEDGSIHYENWGPGPDGSEFKTMEIHSTRR